MMLARNVSWRVRRAGRFPQLVATVVSPPHEVYFTEENNSVLAVAVIASTPGCFSRRSAEIA